MPHSVDTYLYLPSRKNLSAVEIHATAIGSIAAIILLFGWGLGIEVLRGKAEGFTIITPLTAISFMALSISSLAARRRSKGGDAVSALLSLSITAVLIITIILPTDPAAAGTWRQLPSTTVALCLSFGGMALAIMVLAPRLTPLAGILAFAGAAPPVYRLVGFLVWPDQLSTRDLVTALALHISVLVVWFLTTCVLFHPRMAIVARVLEPSLRGRLLRRGLPLVAAVPPVAVVLSLGISMVLNFGPVMRFGATTTMVTIMSFGVIWWITGVAEDWQREANAQTARLSRATEALEQYASSAAHDLKAPARHVMLYSEQLRDALAKGDLAAAKQHALAIEQCASEMPQMIAGLLDYSRSDSTTLDPADHLLTELVQAASMQQVEDLRAAGAKIIVLRDVKLRCDAGLMTSMFQNLIANSLKNRRKDRAPVIRIDAGVEDEWIALSVEDNGVGFDPDFAAVAFNPMARGVHTAGDAGGIGLATCRSIVQSHGGEIRVDPTFRGGARIEFTLPAAGKTPATMTAAARPALT